jgi:putative acetyltransferase
VRETDAFVPALSIVAEEGGRVVGHVLVSYFEVEGRRVLQLGPIGVLPERQGQGIGSALMRAAIQKADELLEPLILLEGNPAYYGRFGFTRADEHGIEMPPESHGAQYFMIRPLTAYDPAFRGRAIYPPETFGLGY